MFRKLSNDDLSRDKMTSIQKLVERLLQIRYILLGGLDLSGCIGSLSQV
jgi:hypothetical protein